MTHLVLALLLAADVDGGTRWGRELYALCPPAPPSEVLDGGFRLLSPERVARLDCIMVTADQRVLDLEAAPPPLGTTSLLFAGIVGVAALLFGLYGGWMLRGLWPW